jgi:hypothetical protein
MKRKDSLTPYPVLDKNTTDYIKTKFEAEISCEQRFNDLYISANFFLNNEELLGYIRNHEMCFVLHIESPSTSFRIVYMTCDFYIEEKIPLNFLGKKIEVNPLIIANSNIDEFSNFDMNEDYSGYSFSIEKGNIIAVGTGKELTLNKENKLENIPSIIKITKNHDKVNGSIAVDTDGDEYVIVSLKEELYNLYYSLGKRKFKSTILSLILLPAMIIILTRMVNAEEDESEKNWYKVISEILDKNDIQVDELTFDNKKNSVLSVAQMIFSDPIHRSLIELENINPRG